MDQNLTVAFTAFADLWPVAMETEIGSALCATVTRRTLTLTLKLFSQFNRFLKFFTFYERAIKFYLIRHKCESEKFGYLIKIRMSNSVQI